MNVLDFHKMKREKHKISMVTCYDYAMAKIVDSSQIDSVLVGDSVAMVIHGHPTTLQADIEMMSLHTAAVARGLTKKFLVSDLPFGTYQKGVVAGLDAVDRLMKAGAHAVKLEGVEGHEETIRQIVRSGVPVMGHIGLTPQSIHQLGGFRVQAREKAAQEALIRQARSLEELGCFSVVLECVPSPVAAEVTRLLEIPTIGIGAGPSVDGQVLVSQDLLGMNSEFRPKFLRTFMEGNATMREAYDRFHRETLEGTYPSEKESYS